MKEAQSLGLDDKYLSESRKSVLNQTESINHSIDLLEEVTKLLHNKTYCVELWKIFVDRIRKPYPFSDYIDIILIRVQSLGLDDICLAQLCTYICNQTQDIKEVQDLLTKNRRETIKFNTCILNTIRTYIEKKSEVQI